MNCEYCNKEFKSKSSLNSHKIKAKYCLVIQGKIEEKENIFKCELCNKLLSSKRNLSIHKEKCEGIKDIFQCEYCNKILSSKQNLDIHTKKCEIIQEKQDFKCVYCDKILSTKQMLEYHKNICDVKKDKELERKDKELKEKDKQIKEKDNIIIKVKTQNENYKEKEQSYKEQIKKQEEQIKDLQNKLDKIANKAIDKPTTTNNTTHNTTNNILNIASHIDFNDVEKIKNIIDDKFTIDNVITGQKGLASFAKEHLLTDENGNPNYLCADASRNVFKYKNPDGEISKDVEAKKLSDYLIVGGIKTKTANIGDKWCRNENGEIDMEKFNILIEPQQSILKLSDDNTIFKRELVTLTSV